jgi:U4/U6 small nuclear ribonucleoprotein PRP3
MSSHQEDLIARKRAEIAAKVAVMRAGPIQTAAPTHPPSSAKPPDISDDMARKVLEAQRRVADAQRKLAIKDNPYMASPFMKCPPCFSFLFSTERCPERQKE